MSTDNFFKRLSFLIVGAIFVIFSAFACVYAGIIINAQKVDFCDSFYFLVTDDTKIEVGAEFAKLEGGAGYLLTHNGAEFVTLSVYLEESEGLSVQEALQKTGRDTALIQKGVERLYFKGKEKEKSTLYISGLNTLKSYINLLNDIIKRLDEGVSQERCKSLLTMQYKQYNYAQKQYCTYKALHNVFKESAEQLLAILDGVVYLKDLRYLLCWQAENYITLCSQFSL